MAMADAQLLHGGTKDGPRRGQNTRANLLEARQNDYKDEVVLAILTAANNWCSHMGSDGQMIQQLWTR